jgi:hypothetical protein
VKFLLFVEGKTEHRAIRDFISRWLNPRLSRPVGVHAADLKGTGRFEDKLRAKVLNYLRQDKSGEIIAMIGLRDLYGAEFPAQETSVEDRYAWGVDHHQRYIGDPRFRMFFAVHETEAWLFSQPRIFPDKVRRRIKTPWTQRPEQVNFNDPPAIRLDSIYLAELNRGYVKTRDGANLFAQLDPEEAYVKCPHLKLMLDTLLDLAKKALKEN